MPRAARTRIQSHQRLLADCGAAESRVSRSGSSRESRWPIHSLLSVNTMIRVSLSGQDRRGYKVVPRRTLRAYRKRRPAHTLDGFREEMVTKAGMGRVGARGGLREEVGGRE